MTDEVGNGALTQPAMFSHEEYLARERESSTRNEYHDGVVVAMTGATWTHNLIVAGIVSELRIQLKGSPCKVVTSDQRVRVNSCNKDFYPDVLVVCGNPVFYDAAEDTILNPAVVVEVLSPSTASYDREAKWDCYRTLTSLQTYMLVSQFKPQIELYTRTDSPNHWNYEVVTNRDDILHIAKLDCDLHLAEVYAYIEFATGGKETA